MSPSGSSDRRVKAIYSIKVKKQNLPTSARAKPHKKGGQSLPNSACLPRDCALHSAFLIWKATAKTENPLVYNDDNKSERGKTMAIGKITVRPVKTVKQPTVKQPTVKQPPVKQAVPKPAAPPPPAPTLQVNPLAVNNAVNRMSICIAAPTVSQAKDFLCGIYCNAVSDLEGSEILIYTRDRRTLSMLTERKQQLQRTATRKAGTMVIGSPGAEQAETYVLNLASAKRQREAADMFFICCSYSQLACAPTCDAVAVLVDSTAQGVAEKLPVVPADKSVNYIICGFEKERTYYFEEGDSPPCEALRAKLKAGLGTENRIGYTVSYAQVYGGLQVIAVEGNAPVYSVSESCRDYIPVGCGRAFFNLVSDFAARRNISSGAFSCICVELERLLARDKTAREQWHETYSGKEEKEQ